MDWWLLLAVVLYLLSAILLVAEVFVPSGGLISFCSLACLAGGVAIFFRMGPAAGWTGVAIAAVMIPFVLVATYRILPRTRFGRAVTLTPPDRAAGDAIPDSPQLGRMVGADGIVTTPLRPVGMCDFSGNRVECVAESGYVEKGEKVKVVRVQATQLTVRVIQ